MARRMKIHFEVSKLVIMIFIVFLLLSMHGISVIIARSIL